VPAPSASTTPPSTQTAALSSTSASLSSPPSAPTPTPTAAPQPTSTPSAARRRRGPRLSTVDRARVEEALREGRRLTRAGQHGEALTQFEAALAIDRGAWRVSCEAGFVAWRAENLDAADRLVREAMNGMPPGFVPEAQRAPTAMCLFNAGLVRQARGQLEDARDMWAESLRLRDNATVRARLAALPPAEDRRRPWERLPATTPIDEIVSAMRADFAATGLGGFAEGELDPSDVSLEARLVEGGGEALSAHQIHGRFGVGAGGDQLVEALVVRGAGAQGVALLAQSYDAGAAESSTSLDFDGRFEDVISGGAPELLVELRAWGGSQGYTEVWGESRVVIVCSVDTGALACFALPTAEMGGEVGGERMEDEPSLELEGWCRVPAIADDRIRFEACTGDDDAPGAPFIEGTHELRALLGRGDLAWPATWTPLEPVGS
jgi:hypothetical protein